MKKNIMLAITACFVITGIAAQATVRQTAAQERFTGSWFIHTANGMAVDLKDHNSFPGVAIHQWTRHDGRSQQWSFERHEDGTYVIRNMLS
ncbi:MAG: RICIN domain-containing protein, partial [Treponema sp.]|nr:RICIN domain-containing protein [Treponema sp.]